MNEKISELLEKLAAKLGTTAEYLWGILLVQAKISATISLVYVLFVVIFGIALYRYHIKFSMEIKNADSRYPICKYDNNDALSGIMIGLSVIWGILFLICFFVYDNIITGYFNSEYWALKEILNSI